MWNSFTTASPASSARPSSGTCARRYRTPLSSPRWQQVSKFTVQIERRWFPGHVAYPGLRRKRQLPSPVSSRGGTGASSVLHHPLSWSSTVNIKASDCIYIKPPSPPVSPGLLPSPVLRLWARRACPHHQPVHVRRGRSVHHSGQHTSGNGLIWPVGSVVAGGGGYDCAGIWAGEGTNNRRGAEED